jgi:hypothetical protein
LTPLDEPLDRGAVARLLDAEAFVGGAPGGDARDLGELLVGPSGAARLFALGDEPIERRRPLRSELERFGDDHRHAEFREAGREFGNGEFERHSTPLKGRAARGPSDDMPL